MYSPAKHVGFFWQLSKVQHGIYFSSVLHHPELMSLTYEDATTHPSDLDLWWMPTWMHLWTNLWLDHLRTIVLYNMIYNHIFSSHIRSNPYKVVPPSDKFFYLIPQKLNIYNCHQHPVICHLTASRSKKQQKLLPTLRRWPRMAPKIRGSRPKTWSPRRLPSLAAWSWGDSDGLLPWNMLIWTITGGTQHPMISRSYRKPPKWLICC